MSSKHGEGAAQQGGLLAEAERLIWETEAELRLLSERRERAIKLFRAQEQSLLAVLRGYVDVRDRLKPKEEREGCGT